MIDASVAMDTIDAEDTLDAIEKLQSDMEKVSILPRTRFVNN